MQENVDGLGRLARTKRLRQDPGFLQRLNGRIRRTRMIVGAGRRDMNIRCQRSTAEQHEQRKIEVMSHGFPVSAYGSNALADAESMQSPNAVSLC
jgi:hypothetical protein